jgi:CRP-like cAMP-binding protein
MASSDAKTTRNNLLKALPPEGFALLERELEPVALPRRFSIEKPDRTIAYVYFPDSGIVSIVANASNGTEVEVGIIGREGMTGSAIVHTVDRSPYSAYMQVEGAGHRVEVAALRKVIAGCPRCRDVFLAFAQCFLLQVSETAVANARATIGERLARWLLMVRDRVDVDEVPLTHEFLALMMGARRPGVTAAIHELSRQGLVTGKRGKIVIRDIAGLQDMAGPYYGLPERELKRIMR